MAARTYIPTAIRLLRRVCQYLLAHRDRIEEVVGGTSIDDLVDAVLEACDALTEALDAAITHGD